MTMQRDPIESIAAEPEFAGSAADNMEMVAALGSQVEIAGRAFPAPCAAALALLDAIQSPFVADDKRTATQLDVLRALYVLGNREKAAYPILRMQRRQDAVEKLQEQQADEARLLLTSQALNALADEEARLDAAAVGWCAQLGAFSVSDAARDIGVWLSLATGFGMLPREADGQKKN